MKQAVNRTFLWMSRKQKKLLGYITVCCDSIHLDKVQKEEMQKLGINKGQAKYNPTIKFADFVAGGLRKVSKQYLEKLTNYAIVSNELQERELTKAFRLENKPHLKKKLGL